MTQSFDEVYMRSIRESAKKERELAETLKLGEAARRLLVALNKTPQARRFMGLVPEIGPGSIDQITRWVDSFPKQGGNW